jgi:hypothetical protein
MGDKGLICEAGPASPPYSNGPYTWDQSVSFGDAAKNVQNTIKGYTKFDYRPSGGGDNSYALQVRHNVGATSGAISSFDHESHIVADGTATLRGVQGVAVVDADVTSTLTSSSIVGVYGQARVDGTLAGSGFLVGGYFLIEASTALTASHVASLWLDSHQANAVTGNHELLYMTNNAAATMDSVMYIYGGDKITNFVTFDTVDGMIADATGESMTVTKKIKLNVDGDTVYLQAGTMA